MSYEKLHVETADGIATVTIDNPKVNALDATVLKELDTAFASLKIDDSVRAVILTGAGKSFVAGANIEELNRLSPSGAYDYARTGQHLMTRIENLPKPVIAAVNGYALGGGCEIAMACTFRIASEHAVFGQPEVKLGIIPGFGGTQRLPRLVGLGRALEILLTGDPIKAIEAHRIGLANRVVPADELLDEAKKAAQKILAAGPFAVRLTKEAAYRGSVTTLGEAMRIEADLFSMSFTSEDAQEGTRAFLEKREPKFKGV